MSGDADPAAPRIDPAVLEAVYRHAEEGYPEEVCGVLLGPRDDPSSVDEGRRCDNRQNALHAEDPATFPRDARTAYNLAPADLFFVGKSLRGARPVRVIYHSHCDVGAYFSDEDRRAAAPDGELLYPVDWLVVDARGGGARGARLFRFQGGDFVEIAHYRKDPVP